MDFSRRKLIKYLVSIGAVSSVGAYGYLKLKPTSIKSRNRAKVAIIGLGSHGIAISNYLRRFVDNLDITSIDNNKTYTDRFDQSLDLVRGLTSNITKPKEEMLNLDYQAGSSFRWYDDNVIAINPNTNRIQTERNGILDYDALILAPGLVNIESEFSSADSEKIGSFYYDFESTSQTLLNIRKNLKADRQVTFYYPNNPTPSRGHFFENMLLANFLTNYFQSGKIQLLTSESSLHPISLFDQTLSKILTGVKNINYKKSTNINGIDLENSEITISSNQTNQLVNFDYICYAPEARVANFVGNDILMNNRFIPVNQNTLQHNRYPNIFSLGDAADLNVEKSLLSISEQVSVAAQNMISYLDGRNLDQSYDGYTVFSVMNSKNIGYYWERNNSGIVNNNFHTIEIGKNPSRQQKLALTAYSQAKYQLALRGFLV